MVDSIVAFLKGIVSNELTVFIVSLLPVLELRGGLIAASIMHINWFAAFPICVLGNMLPIPLVLLFIRKILDWMGKFSFFKKFVNLMEAKAEKNKTKVLKYEKLGLFILVAIPLPGTGAWTGALLASFMDMRMKSSLPIIFSGVVAAGLITSFVSYVIPSLF